MTTPSRKTVRNSTIGLHDRQGADFRHQEQVDAPDYASFEPLITTAILTATAFRLRDNEALIEALRRLVHVVRPFESDPSQP